MECTGRRETARGGRSAAVAGVAMLLLVLSGGAALAIQELEAEENISELLPNKFPGEGPPEDARSRSWALLPEVGFGPDTGAMAGVKFTNRDLLGSGTTLDMDGTYALKEQQSAVVSISSPTLADGRLLLLLRAKYGFDPQLEFFGLGNNDFEDPVSTHLLQEVGGAVTVGWRPFERVAFNFSAGLRHVDIRRGKRRDELPFTPDAPEYETLPGIDGGTVNPLAVSLVWNNRDDVMRPRRGWRVIAKVVHTNTALLSDFDFTRFILDAGYLRYVLEARSLVLGVRVNGEWIEASNQRVPFWEMSELGGQDTLRGFFPHRFLGRGRVLVNGEARFGIAEFDFFDLWHVNLDGVLFGDGGRVFLDRTDLREEFGLDADILGRIVTDFQYDYGGGLRIALGQALVARIDAGFSEEEVGLVYLSFGQTF